MDRVGNMRRYLLFVKETMPPCHFVHLPGVGLWHSRNPVFGEEIRIKRKKIGPMFRKDGVEMFFLAAWPEGEASGLYELGS